MYFIVQNIFFSDINDKNLAADDPIVISSLKKHYLFKPSTKSYNFSNEKYYLDSNFNPSMGQAQAVDAILAKKVSVMY